MASRKSLPPRLANRGGSSNNPAGGPGGGGVGPGGVPVDVHPSVSVGGRALQGGAVGGNPNVFNTPHHRGEGGYSFEEQKVNGLIRKMMRDDATSRTIG